MNQSSKVCVKCGVGKSKAEFQNNKTFSDLLHPQCRICRNKAAIIYKRTIPGLIGNIYSSQVASSKRRGMARPSYTQLELSDWIRSNPSFYDFYNDWVESNYSKYLRPSVDRLDDYKGYDFDNIQLLTWQGNSDKAIVDRISGKNRKQLRAVVKYSLEGVKLEEYYSMAHAARMNNMNGKNIVSCCKGTRKTTGGFKWKYKETK